MPAMLTSKNLAAYNPKIHDAKLIVAEIQTADLKELLNIIAVDGGITMNPITRMAPMLENELTTVKEVSTISINDSSLVFMPSEFA